MPRQRILGRGYDHQAGRRYHQEIWKLLIKTTCLRFGEKIFQKKCKGIFNNS
jgi:hypothetical protein